MTTTLELAEAIARAVMVDVYTSGMYAPTQQAQAVFKVLREHDCWFCQLRQGLPSVQMELTLEETEK